MIYFRSGIQIIGQFTDSSGTTYPANWLVNSSPSDRTALGFITLTEVYPTLPTGNSYDGTYVDNFSTLTRTYGYSLTPIPPQSDRKVVRKVTANTTVLLSDYTIQVDASAGNVTVTLLPAASCPNYEFDIKKIDTSSNIVYVVTDPSTSLDAIMNTIPTVTSFPISGNGTAVPFLSDGINTYSVNQ